MEPEVSLLHSQAPATCPYPKPDQSIPSSLVPFFTLHINVISQPTLLFTVFLPGQVSRQKHCTYFFSSPSALHMAHPSQYS